MSELRVGIHAFLDTSLHCGEVSLKHGSVQGLYRLIPRAEHQHVRVPCPQHHSTATRNKIRVIVVSVNSSHSSNRLSKILLFVLQRQFSLCFHFRLSVNGPLGSIYTKRKRIFLWFFFCICSIWTAKYISSNPSGSHIVFPSAFL